MSKIIELKNVVKSYWLGRVQVKALRGLNFNIGTGEFLALIGASGSGKSTLLNLIGCLDDADSGEIFIDGKNVTHLSENEKSELRNRKIGFIFQSFNLIPVLNVYENIEIPLLIQKEISASERRERIMSAVRDVGLMEHIEHLPDQLSGGQRQRVSIARSLVTRPSVILADEPTANLDSHTAHKIIDLLLELNNTKGVTFLFCTHDEKLINKVKRVVRIQDGVIQE